MRPQSVKPLQLEKTHLFHMQKENMGNPYRSSSHRTIQHYRTKPVNCNLDQISIFRIKYYQLHIDWVIDQYVVRY